MKRKQTILLIILMLIGLIPINLTPIVGADEPEGSTIVGDTVIHENNWGRLEVYPHTTFGEITQIQYCNATWKLAANDLDIAFRFNFSLSNSNIYELVGDEWIDRTGFFEHTTYNGKHYYYVENVHFEQDETRRFKWSYDVPFNSSGKWELMAKLNSESISYALDNNRYVLIDPWWNTNWLYSRQITINSAYIENDLTDFPVLVELPAAVSDLSNNGNSIRFTTFSNSSKLSHEMETFTAGGTTYCWVKIPTVNQSNKPDTKFMVYYGNPSATENSTPDTWSNNYVLVYHMNSTNDSTAYYNNASWSNGTSIVAGKISNARDLTGPTPIIVPSTTSINDDLINSYSFEMFVKIASTEPRSTANKGDGTSTRIVSADRRVDGVLGFRNEVVSSGAGNNEPDVRTINPYAATDTWYHVVYSYKDEETFGMNVYVNGTQDSTDAGSPGGRSTVGFDEANMVTGLDLIIGSDNFIVDEFRISKVNRTNSWINATYKNINESDFITVSGTVNKVLSQFVTNATTNITRTNVTLNGFMPNASIFEGTYTYGFWVGTSNPPTDTDFNVTYGSATLPAGAGIEFENWTQDILTEGTTYYAKAWAFNMSNFLEAGSIDIFTTNETVEAPTNVVGTVLVNSSLEITWTKGIAADNTVIIRKVGSYPASVTDGTEVFNASDTDHYEEDLTGNYYFTIWSWNDTYQEYSINSVNVEYGALLLSCFNESNPTEGLLFDILIKNADGTEVYNGTGFTNIHIVDVNDIPFGNNTQIIVNSSNYLQRAYYYDLMENNIYNLSFYLPFANISEPYLLHVEDRAEQTLDLVKIFIKWYINTTGIYENISIVYTDGNGDVLVNLIPNRPYQVTLVKEGYVTQTADYTTSPDLFIKNFVMDLVGIEYPINTFEDIIDFTASWELSNNTLHIHYFDKEDLTLDTAFQVWETGNFTQYLNATYEYSTESDIHIYVAGLDLNKTHRIELNLNHTTLGFVVNQSIYVFPAFKKDITIRNLNWLENLIKNTFGHFELGYVNFFLIFIPCISILIVFAKHPGLGVLGTASWITFISWFMEVTLALLGVASILFMIGIIIIIAKRGKKVTT